MLRNLPILTKRLYLKIPILSFLLIAATLTLMGCGGKDRSILSPGAIAANQAGTTQSQAIDKPVDAVKIVVGQPGLVRVDGDELRKAGFAIQANQGDPVELTLGGVGIPFVVTGDGDNRAIVFYGQPRDSRYSRDHVYWLRRASGSELAASQPVTRTVAAAQGEPIPAFQATQHVEQSTLYLSQTPPDTDHWLWQSIFAPGAYTVTLDLPQRVGGDAALAVSLWGNTESLGEPDHHAILRVNGQDVADKTWDGKGWHVMTATVPSEILLETGNTLSLVAPGDTQANVDVIYLDSVDVTYAREFLADSGYLEFTAPAGEPVAVQDLGPGETMLWDVTDPMSPQQLLGARVESNTLRFQDHDGLGNRRYVVASEEGLRAPSAIEPVDGVDLRQNAAGADYIAVVFPDFVDALQPLVDYRRAQGMRVTVASIDDVYDTFSHGMPDPGAIRDFMIYARDNWQEPAPRFLLLVGDASYDYLDFLPDSTPNFVPTYLLATHFVGETASDNWFVSLEAEGDQPDMAVGRIPAQTAEQVADVVAKTLAYEQGKIEGDWAEKALFVADDKESNFQTIADDLASTHIPPSYQIEKIYLGKADDPSEQLLRSLKAGVGLVTYVGHGSMNVWAQEKIFQTDDVAALDNQALPFMMTMTCLVGYFHHPQATSMGEELLFNPNGGVVAALVPTSESLATDQSELASNIFTHLFGTAPTVGEAIMLGKRDLSQERDTMQDLIETFVLLGDPALRLRQPDSPN